MKKTDNFWTDRERAQKGLPPTEDALARQRQLKRAKEEIAFYDQPEHKKEPKPAQETKFLTKLKNWARAVKTRDNFVCQYCGSKKSPHAHHKIPRLSVSELAFDLSNGVTLCQKHHFQLHHSVFSKPKICSSKFQLPNREKSNKGGVSC